MKDTAKQTQHKVMCMGNITLREEYRLRMFDNTVPRKKFGPKELNVTGKWRRLHNEELNDLHSS